MIKNTTVNPDDVSACECAIIGAGPAGLTAAIYLARFHRKTMVCDAGSSRASLIPASHNYPGIGTHGIPGKKLLSQLRRQAQHFGAHIVAERIVDIHTVDTSNDNPRFSLINEQGTSIDAQRVLIATGMDDLLPQSLQSHSAIRRGIVRLCSICDGYETLEKCVAVLGVGSAALTHALFLRTFCQNVTAVVVGNDRDKIGDTDKAENDTDEKTQKLLHKAKIVALPIIRADVDAVQIRNDVITVMDNTGRTHRFDCIYPAMGCRYRVDVARSLKIACDDEGAIKTDDHCRTSVHGVFAAGDVTPAVKQICVAVAQGAIAAIAMHNSLDINTR